MTAIKKPLICMETRGQSKIRGPFMLVLPEFKMTKVKWGKIRKGKKPIRAQKNRRTLIQTYVMWGSAWIHRILKLEGTKKDLGENESLGLLGDFLKFIGLKPGAMDSWVHVLSTPVHSYSFSLLSSSTEYARLKTERGYRFCFFFFSWTTTGWKQRSDGWWFRLEHWQT